MPDFSCLAYGPAKFASLGRPNNLVLKQPLVTTRHPVYVQEPAVRGRPRLIIPLSVAILILVYAASCGGGSDICDCTPTAPASKDFRHAEKHVPLPSIAPVETTVAQILGWPFGPDPTDTTPRTGRELTLYHVATAYLQNARLISFDCDMHLEISDTSDKAAPRVIVETPIDSEYCDNRKTLQDALAHHGFKLRYVSNQDVSQSELPQALRVSVLGLAFRDFEHNRGSQEVGTPWELHPAEITVLQ